jgi:hypothetical protein
MDYEEIIEAIGQAGGGLSWDTAERAAQATLQTLAERLPRGKVRHILWGLPAELKPFIYTETDAEALDVDEFLSRVADREGRMSRPRCGMRGPCSPRSADAQPGGGGAPGGRPSPDLRATGRGGTVPLPGDHADRPVLGPGRAAARSDWAAPRPARSPRQCSRSWRNGSLPARWRTSWPSSIRRFTRRCGRAWRRPRRGAANVP